MDTIYNKTSHNSKTESVELQRFVDMGRISATLLHEISSPLTVALIHLDQLSDQSSSSNRVVKRSLKRLVKYVNAAREQLTSSSTPSYFYADVQIKQLKPLLIPLAKENLIKLRISDLPHVRLYGDRFKFQQIITNLIVNAIEASGYNQARVVKLDSYVQRKWLIIEVSDYGIGINKSQQQNIFKPFYSTKKKVNLGLGLSIVQQAVNEYPNGQISFKSRPSKGTIFRVKLPLS